MKANYKMTQMERIEHRKMIEKYAKNNVQKLLMGNDWLKSGEYTPCLLYTSPSPRDSR